MPDELVISGPAGTGKTFSILRVLHCLASDEDNLRILFLRLTRASLSESVLACYEQEILPDDGMEALAHGSRRPFRHAYYYPNGSEIVVGGMDRPDKILSTNWDIVFINECREVPESTWEMISTRLNRPGRREDMGFLIGDTNPDAPTHWIRKREQAGLLELWPTVHEANPALWDGCDWTDAGIRNLERLDRLTGVRALRLYKGIWAGVEGQVYDEWDDAVHCIEPFKIPDDWPRYRSIDFGFSNPFVCQWWAHDWDGRLYLYRELYGTNRIVSDWAELIKQHTGDERIEWTVCDHDAEDRATLDECGIRTRPASKSVKRGIEAVQMRLRIAGDGKANLFILKNSLVEADPRLVESKKPTCLIDEVSGYIWAPALPNRPAKEEPVKLHDHGCDCMRYAVAEVDGLSTHAAGVPK